MISGMLEMDKELILKDFTCLQAAGPVILKGTHIIMINPTLQIR